MEREEQRRVKEGGGEGEGREDEKRRKKKRCCLSYSLELFKKITMKFGLGLGQNFQQFLSRL